MSGVASSGRVRRKATSGAEGRPEEAAAGRQVARRLTDQAEPARALVVRHPRRPDPPLHAPVDVVAEVLADRGQRVPHRNAVRPQHLRRADAGQFEKLRRGDGAGAQDDLARRGLLVSPALPARKRRRCSAGRRT